ncbi:IS66-like element accessory protein TnpA [Xenorhabdus bovienii]|uniref:IS66-like element accessory protein TnpA n=2 Tax=Xenorhabdus bovienii TaxID=40576 RepID=UPI0023B254F8|nr:IS66-like element accessory protein TnpA [Xenorhabdus bovienii]MDE9534950.1 IS66-like element accessory protein TnpA [Xenorhabdus bovienii]MDE9587718.1 IS66-like element accessory protein TnpA [Xenorhabdus bovienii]
MKYRTLLLDALRLHFDEHISRLDVGRRLGIPKSTICDLFVRFKRQGISWPLPDNMTSDKLESQLYPARTNPVMPDIPEPVLAGEPVVRKRSRRPNFPLAFKISLAEKSLQPGANVAQLAREHGINDNLLFNWRNLYKRGLLSSRNDSSWLLPVTLAEITVPVEQPVPAMQQPAAKEPCCELALPSGILRIRGELTPELLRMLISEMKAGG